MLSFLYTHCKKYKPSLLTISGVAGSAIGFLWGFDLQKLTPSGTLSTELLWQLRMFLTPILIALYFLTLLVITLYHYKKETEPDLAQRLMRAKQRSEELSLSPKFGIYWDRNKEPFCPICKTPLSQYKEEQRESGNWCSYFVCPKCKRPIYLQKDETPITLQQAKQQLP